MLLEHFGRAVVGAREVACRLGLELRVRVRVKVRVRVRVRARVRVRVSLPSRMAAAAWVRTRPACGSH